jgi:transitional endoplasmic reticulum ATPase
MLEDIERLLQQSVQAYQAGMQARGRGETDKARLCLLQASESLFQAAQTSRGRLRQARKSLAQELLAEAEAMKHLPVTRSGRSPGESLLPPRSARGASGAAGQTPGVLSLGDDEQAASWLVRERPSVTFNDVAGLEEVKEQIRLKLLYPFTHPEVAAQYGIQPGGGILLYGPPGTGKTLIARAVAGEIRAAFFAIKPSEVMSQWVGVAEQNLARLFAEAAAYERSVIFIDEMESLAPKRRSQQSTVMARVVPQLLAEMDGFHQRENALLLIGATNEPWALDSAILRPGRLDRLIYIPPPDTLARRKILELNLHEAPLAEDVSLDDLAARTANFSGADMAALVQRTRERVFSEAVHTGFARPVGMTDFNAVLAEIKPSIPEKDLTLFERFAGGEGR